MNETEHAPDGRSRLAYAVGVGIFVFFLSVIIFIGRFDSGFVLGLLPAALVGALVGWLAYRSLWIGIGLWIVFEFLLALM